MSYELYNLPFYNNSGETIPPFAVMQVDEWKDDANDRDYFRVRKPNGSGKQYIVNGPLSIPAGSDGLGSRSPGIQASYNNAATPAVYEEWGPVNGSWLLTAGASGFNITGDLDSIGGVNVVRVSEATGGYSGRIIRVQVNESGGYTGADSVVNWDNPIPIVPNTGWTPPSTGTFDNSIYQQTGLDNDIVFLNYNINTDTWEPERGGTAGSIVIYFELTEDKSYADDSKLAKPVAEDGTLDTGATAFNVVDDQHQYYGKAAAGGEDGYRGHAWRFTDDYNETGVPGYRIIDMEGPAYLMVGVLNGSYSLGGTSFTPEVNEIWGLPSRGRRLPASGDITVYDDFAVAEDAQDEDAWLIAWNETEERYTFLLPLHPPEGGGADVKFVILLNSIGGATWNSGTVKLEPEVFTAPEWTLHPDADGTYTYDALETIPVTNMFTTGITVESGTARIAKVVGGFLTNVDCEVITL